MSKRKSVSAKFLLAYVKRKLHRALQQNESLIDVCIECLKVDGVVVPEKQFNKRAFLFKNKDIILGTPKVKSDGFLQSYAWRKVRMMALKLYGPKCQCCGATPATGAVMNVDHIKPRKLFPHLALDVNNLQVLCHECNHGKGNWDMTDWRDIK